MQTPSLNKYKTFVNSWKMAINNFSHKIYSDNLS